MFYKRKDSDYKTPLEGVKFKTLTHGNKTHLCEFRLQKGGLIPNHKHPNEQTGYMVAGQLHITIDGIKHLAEPGDSWNISANVEHMAEILEDAVVVEVFSPVREDYLP